MLDAHRLRADGRELVLPRYSQPGPDTGWFRRNRLGCCRGNPRHGFARRKSRTPRSRPGAETGEVVEIFWIVSLQINGFCSHRPRIHEISPRDRAPALL